MQDDDRRRLLTPPVVGWVLYDFANTIFSFVVVTRFFNDWIIEERGQPDIYVGRDGARGDRAGASKLDASRIAIYVLAGAAPA